MVWGGHGEPYYRISGQGEYPDGMGRAQEALLSTFQGRGSTLMVWGGHRKPCYQIAGRGEYPDGIVRARGALLSMFRAGGVP